MSIGAVDRLLDTLGSRLPEGACVSWVAVDGSAPPTDPSRGQPPDPARAAHVADLLAGLAQLLRGADGPFAAGTGRVLFESEDRILLVSALGPDGMVAIDAGPGLNVALVRRTVDPLLAEFVAEHRAVVDAPAAGQHRRRAHRGTGAAQTAALEVLGRAAGIDGPAGRGPDSPVPGIAPAEPEPPSLSAMPGEVAAPVLPPSAGPASASRAVRYLVTGPASAPGVLVQEVPSPREREDEPPPPAVPREHIPGAEQRRPPDPPTLGRVLAALLDTP